MPPVSITEKITGFWRSYLPSDKTVLVAVSGGSDSVALVYLLKELSERLSIKKLAIAHINHGLRGDESDGDEQLVREIALELKIPFFTKRLGGHNLKDPGIEQWARQERYKFLHSVMESCSLDYIATGHTADDQAETVIFRMLRGAGVKGLRGILPLREDNVIRPLLFVRKHELTQWLNFRGIPFRTDSSNSDTTLSRNFIRHELLSVISRYEPDAIERMVSLSLQMQGTWGVVEQQLNKWIQSYVTEDSEGVFSVSRAGFNERAVASEGLKALFERHGIPANRFHIEKVFININRSRTFLLPGKWQYHPLKDRVFFRKENCAIGELFCEIPVPGTAECNLRNIMFTVTETSDFEDKCQDNWSALLDRDSVYGNSLIYRQVKTGDVFCPLGRANETNVLHFLAKQGIPNAARCRTGVVVDARNKILWIPGIRLNQSCAVSKSTRSIIKIASKSI